MTTPNSPSSSPGNMPAGQQLGDFALVKKIGAGAMGDVYLGKHTTTGAQAAIKLITDSHAADEAFIARFKREIDVLMQMNHPNIARAVGYEINSTPIYLAMEYIPGPNLADVLRRRSAMFEADVLNIGMQIARGLAHAYNEAGLIHRDIKPMNILIEQQRQGERDGMFMEENDRVKIIDFGLAKSTDAEDQRLTLTGIVMGTPAYMSPEQIRCESTMDFHTDMYAVGAAMYHMLTGQIPFPGDAPAVIMTGHLTQPVPDPGDLVPSLNSMTRQIVMTALAKQPRARYTDYRAMISACEKALKAVQAGPGTMRLLRKPMVRGGLDDAAKKAQKQAQAGMDTMDFPALPGDKARDRVGNKDPASKTNTHKRNQVGVVTSQMFQASPVTSASDEALESKPGTARHAKPLITNGSEALRKVMTEKIEKVRTTARFKKNQTRMQKLDLSFSKKVKSVAESELSLAETMGIHAPAIALMLITIALIALYLLQ